MKRCQVVSGVALVLVATCAAGATRDVAPIPVGSQTVVYSHGQAFVYSEGIYTSVELSIQGEDSRRSWVTLTFTNLGSDAQLVREAPLSASAIAPSGLKKITVLARADLEKRERRRQMWEDIGTGLAAGLNAYNAGQQGYGTAYSSHQGNVSGYGSRSGHVSGSYSGTTTTRFYDPAAAQAAQSAAAESNRRLVDNVQQQQAARERSLTAMVLKNHTLAPGESYSGKLQLEFPRKSRREALLIGLDVEIAGESHPFLLAVDGDVAPSLLAAARQVAESQFAALGGDRLRTAPVHSQGINPSPPPTPSAAAVLETPLPAATTSVAAEPIRQGGATTPPPVPPSPVSVRSTRFEIASPGTARDRATGNEWRIPEGDLRIWADAISICSSMEQTWRVPSSDELLTLTADGISVPCGQESCKLPRLFGKLPTPWVWTGESDGKSKANAVNLANLQTAGFSQFGAAAIVMCIRTPIAAG